VTVSLSEMFHVGIVVPDIEAARTHFSELLGVEWGPLMEQDIDVRDATGNNLIVPNRICYSTSAPYLELIEEVPGTTWVCNSHSNLHHIGFFADALAVSSGQLEAVACPLELMGGHGDGPPAAFAYHRDPLGIRVELVDAEMRPAIESVLAQPPAS
jgi:catechol 2,3-dioxygenase-like lactoylglutathione lyase family enzyme